MVNWSLPLAKNMLLCMFGISKFVYASMILDIDNNAEKNHLLSINKYFVKSIYSVSLHVLKEWFHGIFVEKVVREWNFVISTLCRAPWFGIQKVPSGTYLLINQKWINRLNLRKYMFLLIAIFVPQFFWSLSS